MEFQSRKDIVVSSLIFGMNAFLVGLFVLKVFTNGIRESEYLDFLIILIFILFMFWLYFGTSYELKQKKLVYRSGPFKGKIQIDLITEIVKGKTLWVGFKPALARNGLIVKYNKYDEIYISPKTNETFIKKILEVNSKIKITN